MYDLYTRENVDIYGQLLGEIWDVTLLMKTAWSDGLPMQVARVSFLILARRKIVVVSQYQ